MEPRRRKRAESREGMIVTTIALPEDMHRALSMRAVDSGIRSVQFDSAAWFAQWKAPADGVARNNDAVRLLFAVAPQTPPQTTEPLSMLRELVLDAAYELK
jgi:hypothetical protein